MYGSETLTTVVSSTTMKVPNITAMATSQGLTAGFVAAVHSVITVGTTDMPGRSGRCGSWPSSSTIRTGTRCTTLTKLPLEFSGGSRLNFEPVAAPTLGDVAAVVAVVGVDVDDRRLPARHAGDLRLLEVGGDPHPLQRHQGEQRLPALHRLAGLGGLAPHDGVDGGDDGGVGELRGGQVARRPRLRHPRLGQARLRLHRRHLVGAAAGLADGGLGLRDRRLRLLPPAARQLHPLFGLAHRGALGAVGGDGVLVALARNLVLVEQRLEAGEVLRRLLGLGAGLLGVRLGGQRSPARRRGRRRGPQPAGRRAVEVSAAEVVEAMGTCAPAATAAAFAAARSASALFRASR